MKRSIILAWVVVFALPAAPLSAEPRHQADCWFQCGPYYNPFGSRPASDESDRDYIGGSRGEVSPLLPGEVGYRGGKRGRDRFRGVHKR
jgi:hypothetical protein